MDNRYRFLCLLALISASSANPVGAAPRVNAPYFTSTVPYAQAAVTWFGQVDPLKNYADVRVAYTSTELWVTLSIFDQWLFEDDAATRTAASLEQWDAATVLLDTSGNATNPSANCFRFVGELNWWRPRDDYQAAYAGSGGAWATISRTSFTTEASWRGDAPNTSGPGGADRGWTITFHIPFSTLGVSGPPTVGTVWRLGLTVHDKDSPTGPIMNTSWPTGALQRDQPSTWGQLGFGLRVFTPATPVSTQTYMIRHNLNGAVVTDAMVGGGSTCGTTDFFNTWGSLNYAGSTTLVVQNQRDVADWPCFSKTYVDIPLTSLPAGKAIVSATLTIYQFGGSDPTQAQRSLVQVFTVGDAWSEASINWNNAPTPIENVSQSWVDVITSTLPWPGAARTWDLSWAVADAYAAGAPTIRLALYDADSAYHSGKYFTASDVGEWNAIGRPTLQIVVADATTAPRPPTNLRVIR